MHVVHLGTQRIDLATLPLVGSGGEADVYRYGNKALKVFITESHPSIANLPTQQMAEKLKLQQDARVRMLEHQQKLRDFPRGLPSQVIVPEQLLTDSQGRIVGYSMRLLSQAQVLMQYANRKFREAGISNQEVVQIFQDLHRTTHQLHQLGVVIGDFNDLNVLIIGTQAFVIDADSFQFGKYTCHTFTQRFVDPLLCKPHATSPQLVRSHSVDSDWYAFAVLLMQSLLYVDPYGGIYTDRAHPVLHAARPLHRITVFHPQVRYPKPAIPYQALPENLLTYFKQVFEQDKRGEFPLSLLEGITWRVCGQCGLEHARQVCPVCQTRAPIVVQVEVVRGKVTATEVFRTKGRILYATVQNGKLRWLYHDGTSFFREDNSHVATGPRDPLMRFRIKGNATLIGKNDRVVTLENGVSQTLTVETFGNTTLPLFDANDKHVYWIAHGQLQRDASIAPAKIYDTLSGQTLFWVGPDFGFGFYRAGGLRVAFVFESESINTVNDSVALPQIAGQLLDSTCIFGKDRCWLFMSLRDNGVTTNRCFMIHRNGTVEAQAQTQEGDGSWLGTIRGKCAAGNFLFAATDTGIVRVESDGSGNIVQTREFPDTEPFVSTNVHLFASAQGVYVVGTNEIRLLRIS